MTYTSDQILSQTTVNHEVSLTGLDTIQMAGKTWRVVQACTLTSTDIITLIQEVKKLEQLGSLGIAFAGAYYGQKLYVSQQLLNQHADLPERLDIAFPGLKTQVHHNLNQLQHTCFVALKPPYTTKEKWEERHAIANSIQQWLQTVDVNIITILPQEIQVLKLLFDHLNQPITLIIELERVEKLQHTLSYPILTSQINGQRLANLTILTENPEDLDTRIQANPFQELNRLPQDGFMLEFPNHSLVSEEAVAFLPRLTSIGQIYKLPNANVWYREQPDLLSSLKGLDLTKPAESLASFISIINQCPDSHAVQLFNQLAFEPTTESQELLVRRLQWLSFFGYPAYKVTELNHQVLNFKIYRKKAEHTVEYTGKARMLCTQHQLNGMVMIELDAQIQQIGNTVYMRRITLSPFELKRIVKTPDGFNCNPAISDYK